MVDVELVEAQTRLHSQLPPTRLWTYGGSFPGQTIDVRQGQRLRIAWTNNLNGTSPVKAVWVEGEGPRPGKLAYNRPGSTGGFARQEVDTLTAWTAVHLHGGHQNGLSDGATEYGVTPGNSQLSEYANDQAAAHLFYHDHAMSVTTLNVMSGLVGNYVIRDDEEDRLELPRALRSPIDDRRRQLRHRFARQAHGSNTGQARVGRRRPDLARFRDQFHFWPVHDGERGRVATS